MPWISLEEGAGLEGPHGGAQPCEQRVRCDLCSWETENAYWGPRKARVGAGVWWPKEDEHQGEGEPACRPRCASRESHRASSSYHCTNLNVEAVMSRYWRAPTGTSSPKAPPPGTSSQANPGHVPPKSPPPGTSSKAQPGGVPPKAPSPDISSLATEERLAALAGDALTREALSRHDYHEPRRLAPPPRNTVAKGHPGCVPPKASPAGIPSLSTEERLAALEEEVAKLRFRVAELEEHSSGAATG